MINLILTIIILVLVIYMVVIKEQFIIPDGHLDETVCNYLPWGPNLKSCIDYCTNDTKSIYGKCNPEKCIELCKNCGQDDEEYNNDIERCQWINPFVKDLNHSKEGVPSKITLNVISNDEIKSQYGTEYNSDEVNIEWVDQTKGMNYMIHYVEGTQMNNNVKIIYTDLNFFKFNLDTKPPEDIINNIPILKTNSTYLFKIYGINVFESNIESNILSIST
jgi:hypothetical protein